MSYQFAHTEIHSRAGGKTGGTDYVFDEAQRVAGASPHVKKPAPPELVHGMPLDELRALHDERAAACQVTMKNGKTRRIRSTQNTLVTVVTSFPEELAKADPSAVKDWEKRCVAWLQAEYGDRLKTVVRHIDERHPHLHAYILDDGPEMRAAALHPGFAAQDEAKASGEDGAAARRAYKAAMRQWQDRYWEQVGLPCGMARIGPGRRRLSREAWHAETTAARSVAIARKTASRIKGRGDEFIAETKAKAERITARAMSQADAITAAAENDRKEARTARRSAEAALSTAQALGTRLGAFWGAARGWWVGQAKRIAEEREAAVQAARSPLEAQLSDTRGALGKAIQDGKNLKATNRDLVADLQDARRELQQLRPPDDHALRTRRRP